MKRLNGQPDLPCGDTIKPTRVSAGHTPGPSIGAGLRKLPDGSSLILVTVDHKEYGIPLTLFLAAPELLAELKACARHLEPLTRPGAFVDLAMLKACRADALDAIAKAAGA